MRLGIFGGSFDPVHYGHLVLAESCREQCHLDQVWFVPAAAPPHKRSRDLTAALHRLEMLRLAVGGHAAFQVSSAEIDRGGLSYTIDTLAEIQRQQPTAELFLLMGADSLVDLPAWREPAAICRLAVPVAVRRAGHPSPSLESLAPLVDAQRMALIRQNQVEMPLVGFSSSELRRRVREGLSIRYRTPRAVERYIATQQLYLQPDARP